MAQYLVDHACGHTENHHLTGPHKSREYRLENLAGKLCSDCWQEKLTKERAEQSEKAAESAKASGLPELTGSPKQIAWAETLRASFLNSALQYDLTSARRDLKLFGAIKGNWSWETEKSFEFSENAIQEITDALVLLQDEPRTWAESRKWIDGRDHSGRQHVATQLESRLDSLCPTVAAEFSIVSKREVA